jgi:predicted DNA-binding protein
MEQNRSKVLNIRITPQMHKRLTELSAGSGVSVSRYIRNLIEKQAENK